MNSKKPLPVFKVTSDWAVHVWSNSDNHFEATLLGVIYATIRWPDEVTFEIEEAKLEKLARKHVVRFTGLEVKRWALDPSTRLTPEYVLGEFRKQHPKEWKQVKRISDWILSLPMRKFKEMGLTSDMWE